MRSPASGSIRQWTEGDYSVTTDRSRFDVAVATAFLAEHSYWAEGRTQPSETVAADNSRCYSLLDTDGAMVGGARAVTDFAFFAWIADVFVVPAARSCGLGKFLMRCIVDDLADVDRLFLGTRDAHGLYAQVGFVAPPRPERWMERLLDPPRL
jgi:GNAT superfamily N-acetyltransferase